MEPELYPLKIFCTGRAPQTDKQFWLHKLSGTRPIFCVLVVRQLISLPVHV